MDENFVDTVLSVALGVHGGIFAFGVFVGGFFVLRYIAPRIYLPEIESLKNKVSDLEERYEKFEEWSQEIIKKKLNET